MAERRNGGTAARALGDDRRAVVIQTAPLGDVVLTIPLLNALATRHGPVDVVTTPAAAPLLAHLPAVRQVIPFDKHGRDRGPAGLWRLAARLRGERYRAAWLPHRSFRSGLLARLAGVPERIGYAGSAGRWWYSRTVPCPPTGHVTARLTALADATPAAPPWFPLTTAEQDAAGRWLEERDIEGRFVVLAPGARWGTKRWPGFPALAAAIDLPIVVVGDAADGPLAEAVVAAAPGRAVSGAGRLDLRGVAAVLARSALVVSNDSLALHLAGGLGRPVLALFGPTVPAFGFGPLGPEGRVLEHPGLSCRPCSPHGPERCPLGHHRCMRELAVPVVAAAVDRVLAGTAGRAGQ